MNSWTDGSHPYLQVLWWLMTLAEETDQRSAESKTFGAELKWKLCICLSVNSQRKDKNQSIYQVLNWWQSRRGKNWDMCLCVCVFTHVYVSAWGKLGHSAGQQFRVGGWVSEFTSRSDLQQISHNPSRETQAPHGNCTYKWVQQKGPKKTTQKKAT